MITAEHILAASFGPAPLGAFSLLSLCLPMSSSSPVDEAMSVLASAEARVIGVSLSHLAAETKRNADAVVAINESLHILTRLEQAQGNVLDSLRDGRIKMEQHERRLIDIEKEMPALKEARRWVVTGVLAGIGMMGLALVKLVLVDVPRIPQYVTQAPAYAAPQPAPVPPAARP